MLLTGRVTFSAGGNFVAEVDAFTRARIVGEAAGGSPHNYGDSREVELETLGWTVHVPPQYVEVLGRPDERVAIEPDVPVQIGGCGPLRRARSRAREGDRVALSVTRFQIH